MHQLKGLHSVKKSQVIEYGIQSRQRVTCNAYVKCRLVFDFDDVPEV
jgi:hypothetical protein